jgi:hypothetical protein
MNLRKRSGQRAVVTGVPGTPPPELHCPACDRILSYRETIYGGVQPPERWDSYDCKYCRARFEYRHRTRFLRSVA